MGARGAMAVIAAGLMALAGCGGGGGDAATAAADPSRPLALTAANHADAVTLAAAAGDNALLVAQYGADLHDGFVQAGSIATRSTSCPNGGTQTLALDDRDGSGTPTAGDRITATLRECGVPLLATVIDGTATLEITSAGETLRAVFDTGAGLALTPVNGGTAGVTVRLLGSIALERTRDARRTTLSASSTAADDFRLAVAGGGRSATESTRRLNAVKTTAFDLARTVVTMTLGYQSELLGGTVQLGTPQALMAYLNTYPEQGRLEARGADGAVAAMLPHFVNGSELFDIAFDADGNGSAESVQSAPWQSVTSGFLWWDGRQALFWQPLPYNTQTFSSTQFAYALDVPPVPSATQPVLFQFTRPVAAFSATPTFRFLDQGSTAGFDAVRQDVDAAMALDGAQLRVWPVTPLRHGRFYSLQVSTDGGATWAFNTFSARDALGNTTLFPFSVSVQTPDTMRADIAASATTLVDSAGSLVLDSAGSTSARPIAQRSWRQVSGPALAIATPGGASTTVSAAQAPTRPLDPAVIELTITDSAGEVETARITINLLQTVVTGRVLYLRSSAGDYIGAGQTSLVSDATGTLVDTGGNPAFPTFAYTEPGFANWWNLWLASADGSPLRVGAYENAIRASFRGTNNGIDVFGNGRGCNQTYGRFDVLEIQRDASGAITRIAVDFEQHCESPNAPPLYGSLRVDSSIPLRP